MSLHIHRFIDRIKSCEAKGSRDVIMSLRDAKDLHGDITKLLLTLEHLRSPATDSAVTEIEVSGGSFKNS